MRDPIHKPHLVRKPNGVFAVRYLDPGAGRWKQVTTGTRKVKEAREKLGEVRRRLREEGVAADGRCRWDEARRRFEEEHLAAKRDSTAQCYGMVLDGVERTLRPKYLHELTSARVGELVTRLRRHETVRWDAEGTKRAGRLSKATIRLHVRHLTGFLNWCRRQGLLARMPVLPKLESGKRVKGRPITVAEFERLFSAVPKVIGEKDAPAWSRLLVGLWLSGLRLGEALKLGWEPRSALFVDLSKERPLLRIDQEADKGGRDRLCPITPDFADFLALTPADDRRGFVFDLPSRRERDRRLTLRQISRHVSEMGRLAGVLVDDRDGKYASAHDLRRSFAARWAVRVPPLVLKTLMRHASIATTQEYYVGANAEETAALLWRSRENGGSASHDTLHDTWRKWTGSSGGETPQAEGG